MASERKSQRMRQLRQRMAYLETKALTHPSVRGEWLALRWAISVIVEKYPHLKRPEDDRPIPHHLTKLMDVEAPASGRPGEVQRG